MAFLTSDIQGRIQQAFALDSLTVEADHFSVNCLDLKIRRVVLSIGFCPIVSSSQVNGQFAFTIVPYKMPEFFSRTLKTPISIKYFEVKELVKLLGSKIYNRREGDAAEDRWLGVNRNRVFVLESLDQGLSEILSRYTNGPSAILEIGAAKGYKIPESLSQRVIRTQPNAIDCYHLSQSSTGPLYQMNIEELHSRLERLNRKIPLVFALNVFDVLSSSDRKASLVQLSQLQNSGDHLLFMLDASPEIGSTIKQIETLYPEHVPVYYVPPGSGSAKAQVVLVSLEKVSRRPSILEFVASMRNSGGEEGQKRQLELQKMQSEQNLKIIVLEDFFVENMKRELDEVDYDVDAYYHASFTRGAVPNGLDVPTEQRFVYKPVTEVGNLRAVPLTESDIVEGWSKKGPKLPKHFNDEAVFSDMRKKGQKIFGSEILVIAAQKR